MLKKQIGSIGDIVVLHNIDKQFFEFKKETNLNVNQFEKMYFKFYFTITTKKEITALKNKITDTLRMYILQNVINGFEKW